MNFLLNKGGLMMNALEKLKLNKLLKQAIDKRDIASNALQKLKVLKEIKSLRERLGMMVASVPVENVEDTEKPKEAVVADKATIASWYAFDENRTKTQRQQDNNAVFAVLDKLERGDIQPENLTIADKQLLAKYSGNGGGLKGRDGKIGSAHEYYTPAPIAKGMWNMLEEMGFAGGKVLDPCSGTGIFGALSPDNAVVDAVEMDETSAAVNKYVNGGNGYTVENKPFEEVAANTPDEQYDAIVTNVPFGTNASRLFKNKDSKYRQESLEGYFVLRSLDKLKPRGLAAFLVPSSFMDGRGGRSEKVRLKASLKAEFLGAYRLPNEVFGTAGADVITDVVVFRKYTKDVIEKITELQEQNPGVLNESNVLWDIFLNGTYFKQGEHKKFIIGTETQKKGKYGQMAAIAATGSVADVAKAIKSFGASRINWELLDASETTIITYTNGDVIHQDGQTLVYENGKFTVQEPTENERDNKASQVLSAMDSAIVALDNNLQFSDVVEAKDYYVGTSRAGDVPGWVNSLTNSISKLAESKQEEQFQLVLTGLAMQEALDAHSSDGNFNYLETYEKISSNMKAYCKMSADKSLDKLYRDVVKAIRIHYTPKGYSPIWQGAVANIKQEFTREQQIEALQYKNGSLAISVEEMKQLDPEFNPITDDDWAVSADGKQVIRIDDLLVGNYGEVIAKLEEDIKNAANADIASKIDKVKSIAASRIKPINVDKLRFDIRSPYIKAEELQSFLRTLNPAPNVVIKSDDAKRYCDIENKYDSSNKSHQVNILKLQNRLGDHIKNGTLTLGSVELYGDDGRLLEREDGMKLFREYREKVNAQFNTWVHANPVIMERIKQQSLNPANLYFEQISDESPLEISGISEDWKLHGYQNSFVRRQSRLFGGINGFGVGLGKTATALATVQYAQNVGTKKKTLFVVPNSVLSNWYKEAVKGDGKRSGVYDSQTATGCLFVGADIDEEGNFTMDSKNYARDLNKILENAHNKVFMSQQAFEKIRMKPETAGEYRKYLSKVDKSFAESERKSKDEKNAARFADIEALLTVGNDKLVNAPFFEDMGFDSIVIDEAHHFKNAKAVHEFGSGAKGLGNVNSPSARAIDAMAKTWFIRGNNQRNDGVLCLTATPITNSPLEIYSMMSLAAGESRVNQAMLGANGADEFMELVCQLTNQDDHTITGEYKPQDMLSGLKNIELIQSLIGDVAVIKNASDVGLTIKLPNSEEVQTDITLTDDGKKMLELYKTAYATAREIVKAERTGSFPNVTTQEKELLYQVSKLLGEDVKLIAQPFNLISKMDALILDEELDKRATFYDIDGDVEAVQNAIDEFNKLKIKSERNRYPKWSDEGNVTQKTIKDDGDGSVKVVYIVLEQAWITDDNRILLDSTDFNTIHKFESILDKHNASVSVKASPKLAALVVNVKNEQSHIRAVDSNGNKLKNAKQIVFCDQLALHNKIKRLLGSKAGIPSGKITFVSGQFNQSVDEILDVQDGFNSDEDNKYCLIIANKKAEVGINLQKGTQAIHHLTIAWTPDALTQRNGRGVRQGNSTNAVNIYFYEADGTFDKYRRNVVDKKGDWIANVMDSNQDGVVDISAGLTSEQYDELIRMDATAEGMEAMQKRIAEAEKQNRIEKAKISQLTNLETYQTAQKTLSKNKDYETFVKNKLRELAQIAYNVFNAKERLDKSIEKNASEKTIKKNEQLLDKEKETLEIARKKLATAIDKLKPSYYSEEMDFDKWVDGLVKDGSGHTYGVYTNRNEVGISVEEISFKDDAHSEAKAEYDNLIALNNRLIEASEKSMKQDAKEVDGCYSEEEVDKLLKGRYTKFKNGFAFDGMLGVSYDDGEKVVSCFNNGIGKSFYVDNENRVYSPMVSKDTSIETLVYANTPQGQKLLKELGRRDTKILEQGDKSNQSWLASDFMPEVKQYVSDVELVASVTLDSPLKPPYFVRYITPSLLASMSNTAPLNSVVEKQKEIKARDIGSYKMLVPQEQESLFDTYESINTRSVLSSMKANHVVLDTYADVAMLTDSGSWHKDLFGFGSDYFAVVEAIHDKASEADVTLEDVESFANQELNKLLAVYIKETVDFAVIDKKILEPFVETWKRMHGAEPKYVYIASGNTFSFSQSVGEIGLRKLASKFDCQVAWTGKDGKGNPKFANDVKFIQESGLNKSEVWLMEYNLWRIIQESYQIDINRCNIGVIEL